MFSAALSLFHYLFAPIDAHFAVVAEDKGESESSHDGAKWSMEVYHEQPPLLTIATTEEDGTHHSTICILA
jgi:hypothetical protein